MRNTVHLAWLVVFLINLSPGTGGGADETETAKFVVVAPKSGVNAELGASLYRVLLGDAQRARFERVETIEQAVESQADVIVLALASRRLPAIQEETLQALKSRKIIGIGIGSAMLFGQLGLEINEGQCAHGTKPPASLRVTQSELLGASQADLPLLVFKDPAEVTPKILDEGDQVQELFGLFQPPGEEPVSAIDIIARWSSDPNDAPIVRQGNCVLIGVSSPASQWSKSFAALVSETCAALQRRELEKFSTVQRQLTSPDEYEFQLAVSQSTDRAFTREFYFKFAEPTTFRAVLEHSGSDSVMLSFYRPGVEKVQLERRDAFQEETLTIEREITHGDLLKGIDHYWVLSVVNFDNKALASCKLKIAFE